MNTLRIIKRLFILLIILLSCGFFVSATQYEIQPIKLGMSTTLSGPSKQIGEQLHLGSAVYFDKINKNGGINGVKVQLIVADDGYEPSRAVKNTKQFVYIDKVDALFGAMGTPTSHAIIPILEQTQIPFLMPYSGASFLHRPEKISVFNLRASYADEANEQIHYLVEELKHTNIGLLIQADEFGLYVESVLRKALSKYKLKPIKVARFQRNKKNIGAALKALKASGVETICLVGTYKPLSEFINRAFEQQFTPHYTSVSFTSSSDLFNRINYPIDVMVTEVLPDYRNCNSYWCHEFSKDIQKHKINNPSRLHFEGYINAVVFSKAAGQCPQPLQRSCLMAQLNNIINNNEEIRSLFINKNNKRAVYRSKLTYK